MTVFQGITFLAAGPASERRCSAAEREEMMRYVIVGLSVVAAAAGLAAVSAVEADKPALAGKPTAALVVVYDQGKVSKAHRLGVAVSVGLA
jgi:hypothetical protein